MTRFKIAFSNLACPSWTVEHTAAQGKRLGYDGIELRLLDGEVIDPEAGQELRTAVDSCRRHGLEVCALDTSCCLNQYEEELERELDLLRKWIDRAHTLGVPVLRVFGGGDEAESRGRSRLDRVADALMRVAPEAEHSAVTVCLETHDSFSSARVVAEVLDRVPSPAIGALCDSHHPYRVGEQAEEVGVLLDGRLAHVHVKDARRHAEGDWELVLLGEGEVPVKRQLCVLDRLGYDGYVSVEWEKKWNPELADPDIALAQHILKLREWIQHTSP